MENLVYVNFYHYTKIFITHIDYSFAFSCIHTFICLSVCLCECLSVSQSVVLSVSQFVFSLSVFLPVNLSVCTYLCMVHAHFENPEL